MADDDTIIEAYKTVPMSYFPIYLITQPVLIRIT